MSLITPFFCLEVLSAFCGNLSPAGLKATKRWPSSCGWLILPFFNKGSTNDGPSCTGEAGGHAWPKGPHKHHLAFVNGLVLGRSLCDPSLHVGVSAGGSKFLAFEGPRNLTGPLRQVTSTKLCGGQLLSAQAPVAKKEQQPELQLGSDNFTCRGLQGNREKITARGATIQKHSQVGDPLSSAPKLELNQLQKPSA